MPQRKQILQALLQGGLGFLQGNALGDLLKDPTKEDVIQSPATTGNVEQFNSFAPPVSSQLTPVGPFPQQEITSATPDVPDPNPIGGTAQGFQGPGFGPGLTAGSGSQLQGLLPILLKNLLNKGQ